jgi:branched-chain amino acid transport system substrate-binding protein
MLFTYHSELNIMKRVVYILLLAAIVTIPGCKQPEDSITPSGKIAKIGVLAPLSGSDKRTGENALMGVKTGLRLQPYLSNGDKVQLVVEDSRNDPSVASAALVKLCRDDDISGILLMADSDIALQITPVADHYRTPVLALNATHPDITKDRQFISQLGVDDVFQETVAALYVRDDLLIDRVAVFSDPENAHYAFMATEFIHRFESVGGNIVEHHTSTPETGAYQNILSRLRKKKTQLLYLVLAPEKIVQISRSARKINWRPQMMGSDGLLASIKLQHTKDIGLVDGMMATDFYSASLPKTDYGKKVSTVFGDRFSDPGTTYTALACEGTSILLKAMDRCGSNVNKTCVNDMLRSTEDFEGLFGKISIRADGKAGRPIFVNVIDHQKLKFLVKVY